MTRDAATPTVRLKARGQRLWDDLTAEGELPAMERVLIEEACRLVDRLDRIDGILAGRDRAWMTLEIDDLGEVTIVLDKVLSEGRQQQVALKTVFAELRQARAGAPPAKPSGKTTPAPAGPAGGGGGGVVADLTARIAAARSQAAGQ
ncbi:hypothetical protein [Virgisporangium aliadipatigenens]|uniref:hypothetical protein n=1 Tax=Virgisporangium aliadipatigenens TaxID=741659 RepID=UPI001EF16A8D|nr:hypothetical protein [Virgisporangium aliadipatigenens]